MDDRISTANSGLKPISIKGTLKWIGEGENNLVGGVELTEVLDEITWSNLIHYMS